MNAWQWAGAVVIGASLYAWQQDAKKSPADKQKEEAACKADLTCWAERRAMTSGLKCKEPIERLARFAIRWTDGTLEPKMRAYKWADQKRGTVTYVGDRLQMQNAYGAWQNVVYECDFDVDKNEVVDVRARPGRLP